MGTFHEQLPNDWKTFCTKGHTDADDHTIRCHNWMSPKGRKYKEWNEVQIYFQLQSFEDDIPGVECRPENAKKRLMELNDGVTLEEDIKKEVDTKQLKEAESKQIKRRRSVAVKPKTNEEIKTEPDGGNQPKKRGRKKANDDDEDYVPESEKKPSPKKLKKSPIKKEQEDKKGGILEQAIKEATLDEISDVVVEDVDTKQILANHKIPEGLKIVNIDQPNVKVEVSQPQQSSKTVQQPQSKGFSKATITPVPAAASPSPATPARTAVSGPRAGTPAASSPATTPGGARVRPVVPRQGTPVASRPATPAASRPGTPANVRQMTRPGSSTTPARAPAPRQATPQQRAVRPQQSQTPQGRGQQQTQPQMKELPASLRGQVSFPCQVESNPAGGGSLYRAASAHVSLGQDGWLALRRYCHSKMMEWWQWYQPYYTFPLQVKVTVRNQNSMKRIPNANEFVKFLKTDESLHCYYISECELYCLANILGAPINMLTYSMAGGRTETKWDTYDPHQGLIHSNKFANNKAPLYIIHDKNVQFSRLVKQK